MALEPKIKLCLAANCTGLTFYEETGVYNAATNPGGYGAPNPTLASVDHAELLIWPLYSLTNYVAPTYNLTITPSDNHDLGTSILSDLNIQDGFWYFVYNLYDAADQLIATVEQGYYYYCNTECCVSKLLSAIDLDSCMCTKEHLKDIEKYTRAKVLLESLKNAASCYNDSLFTKIKTALNSLCASVDCKSCG